MISENLSWEYHESWEQHGISWGHFSFLKWLLIISIDIQIPLILIWFILILGLGPHFSLYSHWHPFRLHSFTSIYIRLYPFGSFLKYGYPCSSSISRWDFPVHKKPFILGESPIDGNPHWTPWILHWSSKWNATEGTPQFLLNSCWSIAMAQNDSLKKMHGLIERPNQPFYELVSSWKWEELG